ncbi:asparagine synthetase domain-containing 1 isoform X1 [Olea europaea subsp. europaea]|uniref:Asparagine synthetase domain-containing 1 isoform X1 n=1 Tax=Olea europaea subsp. europaea TaxID=158383 RepID=A0A8S0UDX1_OLEEU|nr:asparagine synthetase domain-containing 1 isoform X1 [Olea europaea subsp. europaea]
MVGYTLYVTFLLGPQSSGSISSAKRVPDSLGTRNILLHPEIGNYYNTLSSSVENEGTVENGFGSELFGKLQFIGATLQLRGVNPVVQPLVDASDNVLIDNGELFGGIHLSSDRNDTEILITSFVNQGAMGFDLLTGNFVWIVQKPCGLDEMHLEGGAF